MFHVIKCKHCGETTLSNVFFMDDGMPYSSCNECGVVYEDHSWYKYVSQEQANKIIETREPRGKFVQDTGIEFIGIDNSDGNAWVEEFPDLTSCLMWLADVEERSE